MSIPPSHYVSREDYFKELNDRSAWVLGFIAADGCLRRNKIKGIAGGDYLAIRLAELEPLHIIKEELQTNVPINTVIIKHKARKLKDNTSKNKRLKGRNIKNNKLNAIKIEDRKTEDKPTKIYTAYEIRIRNETILEDLENLGIKENKTYTLEYPDIDSHLQRHFLRGFFDGDGSLWGGPMVDYGKYFRARASLSGMVKPVFQKIKNIVSEECGVNMSLRKIKTKNNVLELYTTSNRATIIFANWLYSNSDLHLTRKYNLYKWFHKLYSGTIYNQNTT